MERETKVGVGEEGGWMGALVMVEKFGAEGL